MAVTTFVIASGDLFWLLALITLKLSLRLLAGPSGPASNTGGKRKRSRRPLGAAGTVRRTPVSSAAKIPGNVKTPRASSSVY